MTDKSVRLDRDKGPTPPDLLAKKMAEARQSRLRGELVLKVSYREGEVQGSQAQIIENHPAP